MNTTTSHSNKSFSGFYYPEENYFRMPNIWTDITSGMSSLAELKVVEYVLRHTWGFKEMGRLKKITLDEFENGRKRTDGSRLDQGIGMRKQAIISGLREAVKDGYLVEESDKSDLGRIKKFYGLKMIEADENDSVQMYENHTPEVWKSHSSGMKVTLPSEKETLERNLKKENEINVNEIFNSTEDKKRSGLVGLNDILKRFDIVKSQAVDDRKKPHPHTKPPKKAQRDYYAQEIADTLQDQKSLGCFRVIAEKIPSGVIFETLASIKETWREGKIKQSRGALFVNIMQTYAQSRGIDLGFTGNLLT